MLPTAAAWFVFHWWSVGYIASGTSFLNFFFIKKCAVARSIFVLISLKKNIAVRAVAPSVRRRVVARHQRRLVFPSMAKKIPMTFAFAADGAMMAGQT